MSVRQQTVKIVKNFSDTTEHLLDYLLPPPNNGVLKAWPIKGAAPLECRHMIIYGSASSGKTELANTLAGLATAKYGKNNINAISSRGNFMALFDNINDKPVQFLYADDFTGIKLKPQDIQAFHNRRHISQEKSVADHGLIITLAGAHRISGSSGLPICLHENYQVIFKENSSSPWDLSRLYSLIGKSGVNFLGEIEIKRQSDPTYKSHSLYRIGSGIAEIGRCKFDLTEEKYLREVGGEVIPNIIKLTPKPCSKCGKMFEPRKSNHKVCFSCYLQTAAINGRYS